MKPYSRGRRPCRITAFAMLVLVHLVVTGPAAALTFPLPPSDVDVVGAVQRVTASADETVLDIGRRHGVGYEEMRIANPGVDMWLPGAGTEVVVPTRFVLPDAPREGVVLNVAEMRLYYFPPAEAGEPRRVETYAVSIGRQDWSTPLTDTRIVDKIRNPNWYPPESIREEAAADGKTLPKVVPPGPDNPLGGYKMRLGLPGYLIHSTNRPWGVGMRVTHGCVRMYPEDIADLFPRIPVNTPVRIVNQPVKAGWAADELFVEVHPQLQEDTARGVNRFAPAVEALSARVDRGGGRVDHELIDRAIDRQNGIPMPVTRVDERPAREVEPVASRPAPRRRGTAGGRG